LEEKDVTIELFNSKMSGKKKIIVNGQLKAEMGKSKEEFMYKMTLHGARIVIVSVRDGFDIQYNSKLFCELWEEEKRKSSFNW